MKFNNISLTIENDNKMSQKLILMSFIGILLSIVGASSLVTEEGPPDNITPLGFNVQLH